MLFIRLARRKRNPIYDKSTKTYQNPFLYSKWTKWNTIICETSTKMEIFKSNGSFCDFYPNSLKIFFVHKMIKNKAYTWNKHLQIPEIETCKWDRSFCNFTQINPKLSSISLTYTCWVAYLSFYIYKKTKILLNSFFPLVYLVTKAKLKLHNTST